MFIGKFISIVLCFVLVFSSCNICSADNDDFRDNINNLIKQIEKISNDVNELSAEYENFRTQKSEIPYHFQDSVMKKLNSLDEAMKNITYNFEIIMKEIDWENEKNRIRGLEANAYKEEYLDTIRNIRETRKNTEEKINILNKKWDELKERYDKLKNESYIKNALPHIGAAFIGGLGVGLLADRIIHHNPQPPINQAQVEQDNNPPDNNPPENDDEPNPDNNNEELVEEEKDDDRADNNNEELVEEEKDDEPNPNNPEIPEKETNKRDKPIFPVISRDGLVDIIRGEDPVEFKEGDLKIKKHVRSQTMTLDHGYTLSQSMEIGSEPTFSENNDINLLNHSQQYFVTGEDRLKASKDLEERVRRLCKKD